MKFYENPRDKEYFDTDDVRNNEKARINYIRHWLYQEFAYWQDIQLLNSLSKLNVKQFENKPVREIIRLMGAYLWKKHTSQGKHIIIKKACNYALEQSKDPVHAWLGE